MIKEIKRNRELLNYLNSLILQSPLCWEQNCFYNVPYCRTSVIINEERKEISLLSDFDLFDMSCFDINYLSKIANEFFNRDNYTVLINREFWTAL